MPSSGVRILPLGGLGEIGKNMTVVEAEGRIVVVDTGLMFPTADMLGIGQRTLYRKIKEYDL